jgi:hypothetical protein
VADPAVVAVAALRLALALVAPLDRVMPARPHRWADQAAVAVVQGQPDRQQPAAQDSQTR